MIDDLMHERKRKLEVLKNAGLSPYPGKVLRTHVIHEFLSYFARFKKTGKKVVLAGRIVGLRNQGGVLFFDIRDEGGMVQCVAKKELLKNYETIADILDIGDFVEVRGNAFITKSGQKSVQINSLRMLTKSLRPLPSQWHGLHDIETRLRKRYLDLLSDPNLKELFLKKEKFWAAVREFLIKEGFHEVETPVLVPIPGGADAEPFQTHHNALDETFFLRISLEIPLKKIIAGGFEKVFEIGRVFRNEGIDREHLQDFTFMEFYWAYHDYHDLMRLTERMVKEVIKKTTGSLSTNFQGRKINWSKKWNVIQYCEIFKKINHFDPSHATLDVLQKHAQKINLEFDPSLSKGRLIDLIYKKTVRPTLIEPVFLINPPIELVPLAKRTDENPKLAARMQIVACGTELGNGYTELNDPIDQRERLKEQERLKLEGDKEAQSFDEDFIEAMEYGMPPMAGFGFSERLFAVLMDRPMREAVIFPLMRRKKT